MLKISIHQPNFLPYIGFFDKVARSDVFVIADHLDFSKGKDNWHHRNRIRTHDGWMYLTMPVSDHFNYKPFHEVVMNGSLERIKKKHMKSLFYNYRKAPHFEEFFESFGEVYTQDEKRLAEFNISLIEWMLKSFGIRTKVVRSTELDFDRSKRKTDMIIEIVKTVGGTHFISGPGARCYLEEGKFKDNGIVLEYQDFRHPVYRQAYPGFVPNLSAIDLLFNEGRSALKFFRK